MPQVDVRPAALDALARPGSPVTWTLTFPAGYLTGKTWSSSVGGIAITPAIAGDVMTISVTGAQTTTLGTGRHVFLLTETTGAAAVRIAGRLLLTDSATDSPDTSVTILTSANVSVAVTVVSATLGGGSSTRITASVEADTTVVNTVTETAVVTLATPTGLAAGDHLILRAAGNLLNNTGATVNYTLRFKLGATTVFATAAITVITTSASRRRWACEIFVALESLAAQRAGGFLTISSAAGTGWLGASNVAAVLVGQGVAAEDLVTSKNVVLTVEMGTASASADFVCTQASIEFIDKAA